LAPATTPIRVGPPPEPPLAVDTTSFGAYDANAEPVNASAAIAVTANSAARDACFIGAPLSVGHSGDRFRQHLQLEVRGAERDRLLVAEAEVRDVTARRRRSERHREPRSLRQVLHVVRKPDRLQAFLRDD